MRRRGVVWLAAAAATMLPGVSLSGCQQVFEDAPSVPVSVALRGGFIAVANCGSVVPGPWELSIGETVDDYEEFFVATASRSWGADEIVTTDPAEWDEVDTSRESALQGDTLLSVWVVSDLGTQVARIPIPRRGIPEDAWLHPDGTITSESCEAASGGAEGLGDSSG